MKGERILNRDGKKKIESSKSHDFDCRLVLIIIFIGGLAGDWDG